MCRLTVGGARLRTRAAWAKEPRSAITTRVRKRSRLISRMGFDHSVFMNVSIMIFKFSFVQIGASIGTPCTDCLRAPCTSL
ncbi:hypothetical protein D3C72_2360710 [compost metagenome]